MTQEISVKTKHGSIAARINNDDEYPGIWIDVDGEGLILVEFVEELGRTRALVWHPDEPEDDFRQTINLTRSEFKKEE